MTVVKINKYLLVFLSLLIFFSASNAFASYEISDNSVKALWHFDGDSVDSSGNSHNGTDTNTSYPTSSILNQSLFVSGAGYVMVSSSTDFNKGSSEFSEICWLKRNATGTVQWILGNIDSIGNETEDWRFNSDNTFRWLAVNSSTGAYVWVNSATSFTDSNWHLFIVQREVDTVRYYFDNVLDSNSVNLSGITLQKNVNDLGIGRGGSWGSDYYKGYFNECFFLNRSLTSQEMIDIYNSGSGQEICVSSGCAGSSSSFSFSTGLGAGIALILGFGVILLTRKKQDL